MLLATLQVYNGRSVETLGTVQIVNDQTGDTEIASYRVRLTRQEDGGRTRTVEVHNVTHHPHEGAWECLRAALDALADEGLTEGRVVPSDLERATPSNTAYTCPLHGPVPVAERSEHRVCG